jgi:hypothetical protein
MLSDNQLTELTQPIIALYNQIEMKLLEEVAQRFDVYDKIGGSLEWQLKKLDEMGALTNEAVKVIASMSKRSEKEIVEMLQKACLGNIDLSFLENLYTNGFVFVDPKKIMQSPALRNTVELSYKELGQTFKLINTKAIESTKQAYMDIINRAYLETASGVYDYNTSIRNALRDFADQGITGATYRRGNKYVKYSIEGTVRRDTITAVNQLANKGAEKTTREIGGMYVEVSAHIGARVSKDPIGNHALWQGKVYKLDGSEPKYPNLKEKTGYPDAIQGLGGVNCRHRMFPFWPGISVPNPHQIDYEENKKVFAAQQKQRAMERGIRATKKRMIVAKASGDVDKAKEYRKKLTDQQKQIEEFCKKNNLRRQTEREMVQEEYTNGRTAKGKDQV